MKKTFLTLLPISIFLLLSIFALSGCSELPPQTLDPIQGQLPEPQLSLDAPLETIAIVGTNDLHGALDPILERGSSPEDPAVVEVGGALTFSSYLQVLKKQWGRRLLWLDAGDQFQGTLESNASDGKAMVNFFNMAGLGGAAIGNHEFDWGLPILLARLRDASYPYFASNIWDKKTALRADFPNTSSSQILRVGRVRIGVVGFSTFQTPQTTRASNVESLQFRSDRNQLFQEAQSLRKAGAQAVLLLAHAGLNCTRGVQLRYGVYREQEEQAQCAPAKMSGTKTSGGADEMRVLLEGLPPGTFDGVVSGHTHTTVHHWVAGTPVIQGGHSARAFNVLYLTFAMDSGRLLKDATAIEGPVPVCPKIFKHQRDCNLKTPPPASGRGPLLEPVFHGERIRPPSEIRRHLEPFFEAARKEGGRVVGETRLKLDHARQSESPLGNLIADAVREEAHADFALVNSGGIRAPIESGPIDYRSVFRTLPFENEIVVLTLSGQQVVELLKIAQSGSRGFAPVSGLKLSLLNDLHQARPRDLNQDGQIEDWEYDLLLKVWVPDPEGRPQPIDSKKTYRLATIDFLVTGGDDLDFFMRSVPNEAKDTLEGRTIRSAFLRYLERSSPIEKAPLGRLEMTTLKQFQAQERATRRRK